MMRIPPKVLADAIAAGTEEELLQWRLSADDVALMFGVNHATVWRWSESGFRGHLLNFTTFSDARKAPRAFRLLDVDKFSRDTGKGVDYSLMHPALQRDWDVGIFRKHDEHDKLDEHNQERSPDHD